MGSLGTRGGAPGSPRWPGGLLQLAGKQLRVAGRERALPPLANFRPPQRKQELVNRKRRAGRELRSLLGVLTEPLADPPLLPRARWAALHREGSRARSSGLQVKALQPPRAVSPPAGAATPAALSRGERPPPLRELGELAEPDAGGPRIPERVFRQASSKVRRMV